MFADKEAQVCESECESGLIRQVLMRILGSTLLDQLQDTDCNHTERQPDSRAPERHLLR